jgi:uncharacterized membrane protein YhfC
MHSNHARRQPLWILIFVLLTGRPILAQDYLDESRTIAGSPQSTTQRFTFTLKKGGQYPHYELSIQMTAGRGRLRILNPAGRELESMGAQVCTVSGAIRNAAAPGTYTVEFATNGAVGRWHLRIYGGPAPPRTPLGPGLTSAASMMLVAVASVWFWRRRTGVQWRWFWAGAGVWTVAVAAKFAMGYPLNELVVVGLKASLPHWAYLTTGIIYGGLMTGVTEVLFTFIAGLIWRQMTTTAARGVAVGVGAGAFEAALLAIATAVAAIAEGAGAGTWLVAFAPATERLISILCHTASRALVLLAVARRRWRLFWYGFLLLSGVDAVAMSFYLTGQVGTLSPWVMEALIAPFGLVSIPITIWCIRRWPTPPVTTETAGPPVQAPAATDNRGEGIPG